MPLYEYRCRDCNEITEVIQKFSDPDLRVCSGCGGTVERLLSAPAIRFKGSGWYVNDYGRNGSVGTDRSEAKSTSDSSSDKASPAPKAESSNKHASKETSKSKDTSKVA